uniref:Putative secreted protein n=1 Tax=Ixodes ricinus TaxID=34613 RepID=A0A6B0U2A6_IXORI
MFLLICRQLLEELGLGLCRPHPGISYRFSICLIDDGLVVGFQFLFGDGGGFFTGGLGYRPLSPIHGAVV